MKIRIGKGFWSTIIWGSIFALALSARFMQSLDMDGIQLTASWEGRVVILSFAVFLCIILRRTIVDLVTVIRAVRWRSSPASPQPIDYRGAHSIDRRARLS